MRRGLALAVLLLGGCGGGDNGPSKAVYQRDGNRVCARYEVSIGKLGQPTTLGEIGPFITKALPVLTKTVADLGRLKPPNDLSEEYAKFIDAARQAAGRATALRDAASKSDATEVQRLLKEAAAASKSRIPLARAAGLETCAKI